MTHTPGPWFAERTRLDGHEWFVKSEARNLPPYNWNSRFAAKIDPLIPLSGKYVDARSGRTPDDGCCPTAIAENEANAHLVAAAPDMLAALQAVNKLISEAAMTGFNCKDGDWAERLFFSQQATSAAIKRACAVSRPHCAPPAQKDQP